jgi:hypothetical protein
LSPSSDARRHRATSQGDKPIDDHHQPSLHRQWHELIGDPTYADAILDRIVHNAYRLDLTGHSLRRSRASKPPHPRQSLWELLCHIIFDIGLIFVEAGFWIGLIGAADDDPDVGELSSTCRDLRGASCIYFSFSGTRSNTSETREEFVAVLEQILTVARIETIAIRVVGEGRIQWWFGNAPWDWGSGFCVLRSLGLLPSPPRRSAYRSEVDGIDCEE